MERRETNEDEERFREWLDLDQADEDIGLNNQDLPFSTQQEQPIFNCPSTKHTTFLLDIPPSLDQPPSEQSLSSYALDPALLTASYYPNLGSTTIENSTGIPISKITLSGHPHPYFALKKEDGIEQDSHDDDDDDGDDDDEKGTGQEREGPKTNQNKHSRSSSAVLYPQPTLSQTHKRTLSHSHSLINVPDWKDKPSAEEYKMLSSKEKRQLRNKISARNFRHRRKQHISSLEQQLAQRDHTIETLNQDLGNVKLENKQLRSQVEILKQKWADLMKKIDEMSLNSTPSSTTCTGGQSSSNLVNPTSPRSRSAKANGMIPLPNLHKDLGSHTRKPFNGVGGMMGGGNVGVHTTLIPEMTVDVYEEPFLIASNNLLLPLRHHDVDLSPQALVELKLHDEKLAHRAPLTSSKKHLELNSESDEGTRPEVDDENKTNSIYGLSAREGDREKVEQQQEETQNQIKDRLLRMVLQALQIENPDLDDKLNVSSCLDRVKLKACLDGTWVFKLVELSPPPYCLDASSNKDTDTDI